MKTANHASWFAAISSLLLCCAATSAGAVRSREHAAQLLIEVVDVAGTVAVTMRGEPRAVAPEATVELPSRIVTGGDGRLDLAQAGTAISIAPQSDIEIPEAAASGQLIARLVQHRGNVFYDVAPRGLDKLRVESPLLVAVVKGTQFNVAVQEDRTTISLFEGLLEIRTPDGGQVAELRAGEIAVRTRDDVGIRVLPMEQQPLEQRAAAGAPAPTQAAALDLVPAGGLAVDGDLALGDDMAAAMVLTGDVSAGAAADAAADLGSGQLDVGADLGASVGDLGAGLDAGLDLGGGTLDVTADTGADLGAVDLGGSLDAGADSGSLNVGADLGGAVGDVGVDAGLDTGGLDAGLDLGIGDTDIGVDASLGGDAGSLLDIELGGADGGNGGGGLGGLL